MIIGISGPDGAGKSSAVAGLVRAHQPRVSSVYLYGCIVCNRMPPAAPSTGSGRARPRWIDLAHSVADALELLIRLALARRRAPVVITDRSPLDGLARHDPAPGSLTHRLYMRAASRYDVIFLLDADASVLARRDAEHPTADLQRARDSFNVWSRRLTNVTRVDVADEPVNAVVSRLSARIASAT